ncbi:MAG: restriction endonuclease, partial [Dehalococcoidia bacterium]|nr:restriction endonuclease [Dehalococcoidia bacterium]
MPHIYCVRADFGRYAKAFKQGGYAAIGWFRDRDLTDVLDRESIQRLYREHHRGDTSPYVIGQQVGQISRFLFDIQPGDYVLTPTTTPDMVYWGTLDKEPYSFVSLPRDGCPFQHRRRVEWNPEPVHRTLFSVPLQNTMRSSLTVFQVRQHASFFEAIGREDLVPREAKAREGATELVLRRILELDAQEFELLVTNLLEAMGFEAEHVGRVGDGGVDARGEMDIYNVARVKLYVQAKRYKRGSRIDAKAVKALRQNIEAGAQGAFITTSEFQR